MPLTNIMDENTAPVMQQNIITKPTTRGDFNSIIKDENQIPAKRVLRNNKTSGAKRSILGDVTNKHHANNSHHSKKQIVATKKSTVKVQPTTRVTRSMEKAKQKALAMQLKKKEAENDLITRKASPMCISNDLQSMTLSQQGRDYNIDNVDALDPLCCHQYAEEIHRNFLEVEKRLMPSATYMSRQTDVNSKMRAILIDWLVDVHSKYQLNPQTLYIAVNIIDRFLEEEHNIPRQRLQLVGITAMFLASKYEEIYPPEAYDFVRITDNAYDMDDVFDMERCILKSLGYRITVPTAYQFLQRFCKASGTMLPETKYFAHYVIDRSLQEYKLLKYPPSAIAAGALHMARTQMGELPAWNGTVEYHSTYSEVCLDHCLQDLKAMLWSAENKIGKSSKLNAVKRKFSKDQFMAVSTRSFQFDDSF